MTKNDNEEEPNLQEVYKKLEDMDNKLERIKSDTHNLNRVTSLSNSSLIEQELRKIIGNSIVKAAILHLTKDEISAGDLAKAVGISPSNLARDMAPFLGNKGYIVVIKKGIMRYFQRSELVDLIGFESIETFANLIKQWQTKVESKTSVEKEIPKEGANAT